MSSGFSGGNVGLNPPSNVVYASATAGSPGVEVTVYTVPAGKTLYVSGMTLNGNSSCNVLIWLAASELWQGDVLVGSFYSFPGSGSSPVFAATAGQTIRIEASGSGGAQLAISGYLL